MPLFYLAVGFIAGYAFRRFANDNRAAALQREASGVLDSVGKLAQTGALASMDDLRLRTGSDAQGVKLLIKTHGAATPLLGLPDVHGELG